MVAELQHITKIYEMPGSSKGYTVLEDVSLIVPDNTSIAVTGPSGSGKSTLLNILGTLDKPSSGTVLINGITPPEKDEDQLAGIRNRYIGFVFQLHQLLPQLTLMENILLPLLPAKDQARMKEASGLAISLVERVGLKEHIHHYPAQLSVGECQRVAVLRALINKPRLVLADEPTGSLDAGNAMNLIKLISELKEELKFSLVLVTHSPEVAGRMDQRYLLKAGRLIESI